MDYLLKLWLAGRKPATEFLSNNSNKNQRGFTLLELMVCISILVILAVTAIPSFSEVIKRNKTQTHMNNIYHLLVFARSESVSYNKPVTICPSRDQVSCIQSRDWSNKYLLVFYNDNYDDTHDSDERIARIFKTGKEGSKLLWRSFRNKSYLTFMPIGLTDYQSGNITFCPEGLDRTEAKILVMNIAGRPYFGQDTNGDDIAESGSGNNLQCSL